METCEICNDEKDIVECFSKCSLKQCKDCIIKWLKIKDQILTHQCPQCRKEVKYLSINDNTNDNSPRKLFSDWCRNDPEVVDKLFGKYQNYNYVTTNSQSTDNTNGWSGFSFVIDQADLQNDLANIARHLGPVGSLTSSNRGHYGDAPINMNGANRYNWFQN